MLSRKILYKVQYTHTQTPMRHTMLIGNEVLHIGCHCTPLAIWFDNRHVGCVPDVGALWCARAQAASWFAHLDA